MSIRPLNDWLLVKLDPIPEKVGSLFMTGGSAERIRTGTVLRAGPGRYVKGTSTRTPIGVEQGERVAFFRENLEHKQGKEILRVLSELDEDTGLLRAGDILYAGTP